MKSPLFSISGRSIGPGHPPYVIAEMSGNHNGDLDRAIEIMVAARDAGADAIKLQTYTADTITLDHDGPGFRIEGGPWDGRTLHQLYEEAHTPWEWHEKLFEKGRDLGVAVFSSPFDFSAVDFLEGLNCPAYKIASFEIIDLPLIARAAATGKPLILSTGMADKKEIGEAIKAARDAGCRELGLLHCVSAYPAKPEEANLRTISDLAESFGVVMGLSDHTPGVAVSIAAVALGACVIEKHLTLKRSDGGPDAEFSLEPSELSDLVKGCRTGFEALGQVSYACTIGEEGSAVFRRSLYVVRDIAAGEVLSGDSIKSIRPGYGLAPKHYETVLGRRAKHDILRGTPLSWSDLEEQD
jgi:pseudaminic acid synthase